MGTKIYGTIPKTIWNFDFRNKKNRLQKNKKLKKPVVFQNY